MLIRHRLGSTQENTAALLAQFGALLQAGPDVDALCASAVQMVQHVMKAQGCSIMMLDHCEGLLRIKASTSIPSSQWASVLVRLGEGIAGRVALTGEPLHVKNVARRKNLPLSPFRERYAGPSFISAPLLANSGTLGVINIDGKTRGKCFSRRDGVLFLGLANFLSAALIKNHEIQSRIAGYNHFGCILHSVPMGVMTFDKALRLTHCNRAAAEFACIDPEASIGRPAHQLFPECMRARVMDLILQLRDSGISSCMELDLFLNGQERPLPMGVSAFGLDESKGLSAGIIVMFEDLSLRRENMELRHASDSKSHFLSLISHELRTPLTAVMTSLHVLRKTAPNMDPNTKRILAIGDRNARRLAGLVEDILEVQRLETQDTNLKLESLDLNSLVRDAAENRRAAWEEKEIQLLVVSDQNENYVVQADRDRLYQVIRNLLDNAFKFCRINGNVTVRLARLNNRVELRISNCGPMIPMRYREHIFEKFFQVQSVMTRQFSGSGLGLYLARQLLRLHGGDVVLEQSSENETIFLVTLPADPAIEGNSATFSTAQPTYSPD